MQNKPSPLGFGFEGTPGDFPVKAVREMGRVRGGLQLWKSPSSRPSPVKEEGINTKILPLLSFGVILSVLFLTQGCSLLFVSKGKTRYTEAREPQTPLPVSLARQMTKTIVLKYKVQEGDTLESIALIYYGHSSKASKVAAANRLKPGSRLKEGKSLKIVDPVNFSNPKDLLRKKPT